MKWLPAGADVLTILATIVSVGGTLLGLIVGLGQLSASVSARKTLDWVGAALETELQASQKVVLQRLKVAAEARLVAARSVSSWHFSELLIWGAAAPGLLLMNGSRGHFGWAFVASLSAGWLTLAMTIRRAIRLYSERTRVFMEYLYAKPNPQPPRIGMVQLMEGGDRSEFRWGYVFSATLMGSAVMGAYAVRGSLWIGIGALVLLAAAVSSFNFLRDSIHERQASAARGDR